MKPVIKTAALGALLLAMVCAPACGNKTTAAGKVHRQNLFDMMDRDKDGKVSASEYYAIWRSQSDGEMVFQRLDADGNGYLDQSEFDVPGVTVAEW